MASTLSRVFKPFGRRKSSPNLKSTPPEGFSNQIANPVPPVPTQFKIIPLDNKSAVGPTPSVQPYPLDTKAALNEHPLPPTPPETPVAPKAYLNTYSDLPEVVPSALPEVFLPPNPYTDLPQATGHLPAYLSSSHPEVVTPSDPETLSPLPARREFPPAFNLYRSLALDATTFTLGPHRRAPLYAVSAHMGLSGLPPLVLHAGPTADRSAMWADVEYVDYGADVLVGLPPLPGRDDGSGRAVECLSGWNRKWRFGVEVGPVAGGEGGGGWKGGEGEHFAREAFEWRHAAGYGLDAVYGAGWVLVRLAEGKPAAVDAGRWGEARAVAAKAEEERVATRTLDGREVVAVWSPGGATSLTKVFRFEFVGVGASGVLGERWALMAVMTGLALWDLDRKLSGRTRYGMTTPMGRAGAGIVAAAAVS